MNSFQSLVRSARVESRVAICCAIGAWLLPGLVTTLHSLQGKPAGRPAEMWFVMVLGFLAYSHFVLTERVARLAEAIEPAQVPARADRN